MSDDGPPPLEAVASPSFLPVHFIYAQLAVVTALWLTVVARKWTQYLRKRHAPQLNMDLWRAQCKLS